MSKLFQGQAGKHQVKLEGGHRSRSPKRSCQGSPGTECSLMGWRGTRRRTPRMENFKISLYTLQTHGILLSLATSRICLSRKEHNLVIHFRFQYQLYFLFGMKKTCFIFKYGSISSTSRLPCYVFCICLLTNPNANK